jgi:hypothetical protein
MAVTLGLGSCIYRGVYECPKHLDNVVEIFNGGLKKVEMSTIYEIT